MSKIQTSNMQLLKMIKRFPELYNSQHDLANDKVHGMVVWDTISYELDTPANLLKKKWQKLRSLHKKRSKILKTVPKSVAPLPQDEIFLMMDSILQTAGVDSPIETDDSSLCSVPTLSIISEEGRSTRSSSSASTQLVSERKDRSPLSRKSVQPIEVVSSSSLSSFSFGLSGEKSSSVTTRVLRSHNNNNNNNNNNNLRLKRATRSGPPEVAMRNRVSKDASITFSEDNNSASTSVKIRSSDSSENRERKKTAHLSSRSKDEEPLKIFFQSMALRVAKFPQHVQASTKTKIFNIVAEAESELSSLVTMR